MTQSKHKAYPSIEQFRSTIRSVKDRTHWAGKDPETGEPIFDRLRPLPTLDFVGTVKLHGTNAGIGHCRSTGETWFQSRSNLVEVGKDNAGFAAHFYGKDLSALFASVSQDWDTFIIFGEWCGQGIQKNVGISKLPKMFVVFDVCRPSQVEGEPALWADRHEVSFVAMENANVFNIYHFPCESISIDFEKPEIAQNELIRLTTKVADECPVAKELGESGIGEGIVWRCVTPGWADPGYRFKVKDERHATGSGKVKVLAEVDVRAVASYREFAAAVVTDMRCYQAIAELRAAGMKTDRSCLGAFLKWVGGDVVKEEKDVAVASGIDLEKSMKEVSKSARDWFLAHESEF